MTVTKILNMVANNIDKTIRQIDNILMKVQFIQYRLLNRNPVHLKIEWLKNYYIFSFFFSCLNYLTIWSLLYFSIIRGRLVLYRTSPTIHHKREIHLIDLKSVIRSFEHLHRNVLPYLCSGSNIKSKWPVSRLSSGTSLFYERPDISFYR